MKRDAAYEALVRLLTVLEKDTDPEEMARRLTEGLTCARDVFQMDTEDLINKAGVSRRTAEVIDLVDELTRRALTDGFGDKPRLDTAETAGAYMRAVMRGRHVEYCYMASLDKTGHLTELTLLQRGTLDSSNIYIRDIVQTALRAGAASVILAHNHPGGTLRPSNADIQVTRAAAQALELIGVKLTEHVIVTERASMGIIKEGYLL